MSAQTSLLRALAPTTPTYVFPAMNTLMYDHPLTSEHLRVVKEVIGYHVVGPIGKALACGDVGMENSLDHRNAAQLVRRPWCDDRMERCCPGCCRLLQPTQDHGRTGRSMNYPTLSSFSGLLLLFVVLQYAKLKFNYNTYTCLSPISQSLSGSGVVSVTRIFLSSTYHIPRRGFRCLEALPNDHDT